ncbi:hypothetical protein [Gracilimonas tropica]|uniref:hypothetical protein n=1 Tax=Gracilimonas tropica TaxID=454600 RepID=UPI00037E7992|nr:hypothetical protein [Gracilimonas tropica]
MGTYKQKRSRKPLSLDDAQLRMTDSIKQLEKIILTSEDENRVINASNALSGLISRYAKLLEVSDLEKRIEHLERINENQKMRKVK